MDCKPSFNNKYKHDIKQRLALCNNGRMLVKTTLIEVPQQFIQQAVTPFEDQPELRDCFIWYIDFVEGNSFNYAPSNIQALNSNDAVAAGVNLTLVDYNNYNVMDEKPVASLITTSIQTGATGTFVNSQKNGMVGQNINWTKSSVQANIPASLPGSLRSYLFEVGYSYFLDWRDDPLSSFAKKK